MEDRIIVEVVVPGTDSSFDFQLPVQISVQQAASQIATILETLEHNVAFDRSCLVLCDMDRGLRLNSGTLIANARVRDGSRLMLL